MQMTGRLLLGISVLALFATVNLGCSYMQRHPHEPQTHTHPLQAHQPQTHTHPEIVQAGEGVAKAATDRSEMAASQAEQAAERAQDAAARVEAMFEKLMQK
jgi:hypothetical protein